MTAMNISCHAVDKVAAKFQENGSTQWVDLTVTNRSGEIEITLFPATHGDPRFAALAEFIAATWTTEGAKAVETPDQYTNYLDRVAAETPSEDLPL